MSAYFYLIVKDALDYDDGANLSELYALKLIDMRNWCEEMLDVTGIPHGPFRTAFITDMFADDSDEPYKLWRYIQDNCCPDPDEDSDDEESDN